MRSVLAVLGVVVGVSASGCCAVGDRPSSRERIAARAPTTEVAPGVAQAPRSTAAPVPTLAQAPDAEVGPSVLISIEATDEPVRDVIDTIARAAGQNIVCDPSVTSRCTITLRKLPWREAVYFVAAQNGCEVNELRNGVLYAIDPPKVTIEAH